MENKISSLSKILFSQFKIILVIAGFICFTTISAQNGDRNISVDFKIEKGPTSKVWQECVGAGRAYEGLRADWQNQLTFVQKELGFKYIRFHGLLHDEMGIYSETTDGKPIYNWQYLDRLYDYLLSVNIRPIVELGFTPFAMTDDHTSTVFWWKAYNTPPKSYEKWGVLITELVKHFEERYGKTEVNKWFFEVWNEPNLKGFWTASRDQYFDLYKTTVTAIKTVSPTYQVGGPATSGSTWIREFLTFCGDNKLPIDFIATHSYGTKTAFDEFGKKKGILRLSNDIPDDIKCLREWIDASPYKGSRIFITEWSSSSSPKDKRHDTYQNAAFVLHVLRNTEIATAMSYWTFTDIFEEPGPQVTPFHGGFGLLNLQDIKKPTYWAYKFLSSLGSHELKSNDSDSYVCKDEKGNIQALFWDFMLQPDASYAAQFFDNGTTPIKEGKLSLNIKNVPNGKYKLQVYQTGYKHNDVFNAYKEMGSPYNINKAQEAELKKISNGDPILQKELDVKDGNFSYSTELLSKDVFFVKLDRFK